MSRPAAKRSTDKTELGKPLLAPIEDIEAGAAEAAAALKKTEDDKSKGLLISFILMVVIGLGNKIFQVLEYIPMTNYPLFINLLTTFVYIPVSFAYIVPMMKWGTLITKESTQIPQYKWAVMGFLDSLAGIMQSLAVNYVNNGSLVTLLMQFAIPSSMIISFVFLRTRYKLSQYLGAVVVAVGLVIVLLPTFEHSSSQKSRNPILWSFVLMFSCVPMCLSSVYKEKALGDVDIDPVYLNGWVAVYQFLFSIPLLIPSAIASNVSIPDLPSNLWNGIRCLAQADSVFSTQGPNGLQLDRCGNGPAYVSIYILFNLGYNVLIILILKYGSSNILWLAMTVMVPLTNFAFVLKFMPNKQKITWEDVVGLLVIMTGLLTYRFWAKFKVAIMERMARSKGIPVGDGDLAIGGVGNPSPSMATPLRGTLKHIGGKKKGPSG